MIFFVEEVINAESSVVNNISLCKFTCEASYQLQMVSQLDISFQIKNEDCDQNRRTYGARGGISMAKRPSSSHIIQF